MTFAAVVQLWLLDVKATCSPRTYDTYEIGVSKILECIPELQDRWITRADILRFRDVRSQKVSNFTVNRDIRAVRRCINWSQLLDDSPPPVKLRALLLPEPPSGDRTLSPAQIEKLFAEAAWDAPVLVVLRICFATGFRLGETLALRWKDVDLVRGTLTVSVQERWTAKTKASYRTVHAKELVAWLASYQQTLRFKGPDDLVCQMDLIRGKKWTDRIYARMRKVFDRAGIMGTQKTHALRHTLCTDLAEAGAPAHTAQRMLGHASPQMTQGVYTHVRHEAMERTGELIEEWRAVRYKSFASRKEEE